ncbi:kinase-like domain-containing protein [Polychytrium aggregatum]|uniref:kinase-like domain-containing protein n=1 Tax=Polychytrium aggregatum TaxID=110093 RepID=UPI0022FE2363|nr:kinase-like domain-containing protein [Polychytrium aggregatum]KAI9192983.1 kinase-like domain-containing protein [Polychytrium aggregatum]
MLKCKFFDADHLTINREEDGLLKTSDFTEIRSGRLNDGVINTEVAIKMLRKPQGSDHDPIVELGWEAGVWELLSHKRILRLIGVSIGYDIAPAMISTFQPHLDLERYIEGHPETAKPTKVRWMKEIAEGLEYLHSKNVIYVDVKPNNTLVSLDLSILLTDFGCSFKLHGTKTGYEELSLDRGQQPYGTYYYMAPERVRAIGPIRPNKSSDVYSFGITCCDILINCENVWPREIDELKDIQAIYETGATIEIREFNIPGLEDVLEGCLRKKASKRPKAAELIPEFTRILESFERTSPSDSSVSSVSVSGENEQPVEDHSESSGMSTRPFATRK